MASCPATRGAATCCAASSGAPSTWPAARAWASPSCTASWRRRSASSAPAYPHLERERDFILRAIGGEEERFLRTLTAASNRLDLVLDRLEGAGRRTLPGEEAFALYDTFGLPIELTREIAGARDFAVDGEGFERALEEQRRSARAAAALLGGEERPALAAIGGEHSAFTGWRHADADASAVALLHDGGPADVVPAGSEAEVILDSTPFYPEGGGQLGDRGLLRFANGLFAVDDTQAASGAIVHSGKVTEGELRAGDSLRAEVDLAWRGGRHAQPHGHAPAPRRPARDARRARAPARLARGGRTPALRLHPPRKRPPARRSTRWKAS